MATYTRAGSYLLAAELAKDPFGSLHRGIQTGGTAFDRHLLVRTFSDELFQAGMGTKAAEVEKILPQLGGSRAFGLGYRYEGGKTPLCACDYVPGRSLGQLIEKAQHEQLPFGVDHALSVIQGVAQAVAQMQSKGLAHGLLSPHSIWVSFEGAAQLIDAPYAAAMKSYLPRSTAMQNWLAPYLQMQSGTPLQQDLFGVGAILYELLTFKKLPIGGDLRGVIDGATLKAAQEDGPVPPEIKAFLTRLLVPGNAFTTVESFNAELERVLYDGDYSPTTFNMAFFMHTLFREENERDVAAMKAEQAENYTAYTAAGEALRSGATRSQHIEGFVEPEKGMNKGLIIGIGAAVVLLAGVAIYSFAGSQKNAEAQKLLVQLQQQKALLDQEKADLEAQNNANQQKQAQIQQQLSTTTSASEKAALQKQLEDAQKKQQDLEARKEKVAAAAQQAEQKTAQIAKTAKVEPPPVTKPEPPAPQPQQQAPPAPTPVAPTPVEPPPSAQQTGGTLTESPAQVTSRATPSLPPRARTASAWGAFHEITVKLRVFVDETGRPLKATVLQGSPINLGFDDASVNAAMQSQYSPATRNGQPTRGTVEMIYNFKR
ncbi:MAG TPA: energy transducer TonB [Holophagaceae bacterium]|jgi:TonB family protein|nr:energy transducer TonB [Holophagaceae bacterium]